MITLALHQPDGERLTMAAYLDGVYTIKRSLQPKSVYQYEQAIADLERFAGRPISPHELTDDLVNAWLRAMEGTKRAKATIRNRRTHLMTLWAHAHKLGYAPLAPVEIRATPVPYVAPRAWNYREVQRLLDAADRLQGFYPDERWVTVGRAVRIRRSTIFGLLIRIAWDTGLRQSDIFQLRPSQFDADGVFELVMGKVRRWHISRVHPETLATIHESVPPYRDVVVPWRASEEMFRREFTKLVASAGISPGSFKKLRKSSATEVDGLHPGCGAAHLGHASERGITGKHYLDPRLLVASKPMPRPLRELPAAGQALVPVSVDATPGDSSGPPPMLLSDALKSYNAERLTSSCKTLANRAGAMRRFDSYLRRPATVADLRDDLVRQFAEWLCSNGYRSTSATIMVDRLLAVWRHLARKRLVEWPSTFGKRRS